MSEVLFKPALFAVFAAIVAAVMPVAGFAHLLDGNRGPVDAYDYDEVQAAHLNEDCAYEFECRPNDQKGVYFYGCYYDVGSSECQCSEGELSRCNRAVSSLAGQPSKSGGLLSFGGSVAGPLKSSFGSFGSLPLLVKVALVAVAAGLFFMVFTRLRDSVSNNLRRARSFHEKGTSLHEKGLEEEARLMFEKANYYRERAQEQAKNGMV
ncbi:hypothetical protein HYU18_03625 [Candidatus Woesearchaeota archaeon]|nr:hypothetical protein [Candidatus Woesearchaeota archaeon]